MAKMVVGVRFKKAGKVYYFDPKDIELKQFDHVVVETSQGIEYGEVALSPRENQTGIETKIKPVLRKATQADDDTYNNLKIKEKEAKKIFDQKVIEHKLEMKLISVEYTFDKKKAIFYFTSEGRVDFRDLVKDLASIFRIRIELRQIGVRDEAKIFNTLGVCGRTTCCASFLGDFAPVSIKMAKVQNISLNSAKISGVCGRLLCCLAYEHEFYNGVNKQMPKVGAVVQTPEGLGQVIRQDILKEQIHVRVQLEDDKMEERIYTPDQVERTNIPKCAFGKKDQEGNKPQAGCCGQGGGCGQGKKKIPNLEKTNFKSKKNNNSDGKKEENTQTSQQASGNNKKKQGKPKQNYSKKPNKKNDNRQRNGKES